MKKNNCIIDGHQYGLWQIENENEVSRTCLTCEQKRTYPMTSDTLKEIKKQQEANQLLTSFLNITNYDNNLIGYLNVILDDVLDYISPDNKNRLVNKLKEIILVNKIKEMTLISSLIEEDKILLEKLITSITNNNQDLLFDTLVNKSKEIILSSTLNEENKILLEELEKLEKIVILLEKLVTSITSNNQDLLFDTIEYFKIYNNDILTTPPIQEQTNLIK